MGMGIFKSSLLATMLILACSSTRASLIYTYDFPGPGPNNGAAANQTNPQPPNATFSDYTRNGGLIGTGNSNAFGSTNWSTSASLDPTIFTAFTITANAGFVLDLTQLTFQSLKTGVGPANAEVDLFLNGSATAYATFDWTPVNATLTSYTFSFTPLTPADNVTTATFKFFAWNATDNTNGVLFANVATYGTIDLAVPEFPAAGPITFLVACIVAVNGRKRAALRDSVGGH
jgi:hypothetical protein